MSSRTSRLTPELPDAGSAPSKTRSRIIPASDLAALVSWDRTFGPDRAARQALAAYGTHDADLVDALMPAYVAWVTASMLTALPRRPELADPIDARLRWLSQQ